MPKKGWELQTILVMAARAMNSFGEKEKTSRGAYSFPAEGRYETRTTAVRAMNSFDIDTLKKRKRPHATPDPFSLFLTARGSPSFSSFASIIHNSFCFTRHVHPRTHVCGFGIPLPPLHTVAPRVFSGPSSTKLYKLSPSSTLKPYTHSLDQAVLTLSLVACLVVVGTDSPHASSTCAS